MLHSKSNHKHNFRIPSNSCMRTFRLHHNIVHSTTTTTSIRTTQHQNRQRYQLSQRTQHIRSTTNQNSRTHLIRVTSNNPTLNRRARQWSQRITNVHPPSNSMSPIPKVHSIKRKSKRNRSHPIRQVHHISSKEVSERNPYNLYHPKRRQRHKVSHVRSRRTRPHSNHMPKIRQRQYPGNLLPISAHRVHLNQEQSIQNELKRLPQRVRLSTKNTR